VIHEPFDELIALDAVGALTPEEKARLDAHLATCPECRREQSETREAAALMALSAPPVAPPPEARERLMEAVRRTPQVPALAPVAAPSNVVAMPSRSYAPLWAAAALLLLAFGVWNQLALTRAKQRNEALMRELIATREEVRATSQQSQELASKLDALVASKSIELAGQETAPGASARVFMNGENRTALVFFQNLPPAGPDHSYQLWVIRGDRPDPQSVGVFDVDRSGKASLGLKDLPVNTEIKAFAVTLEPRGGVRSPTGAKYLVGG
jgi:hypothetical protein